jgi:hypothetical protein
VLDGLLEDLDLHLAEAVVVLQVDAQTLGDGAGARQVVEIRGGRCPD